MHRQFARAHYYKSLPQDDGEDIEEIDEEPTFLQTIQKRLPDAESDRFAMAVGVVIMANALVLGLETDLGQENFIFFEHFFGMFFTGEMFLRISQSGCLGYLSKKSNCFDCLLVCTGDFDLWISPFLTHPGSKGSGSPKFMKLLRMFRVMRIVRLFKMFHELQIIMEAFIKALHTVMWVGLLTVILNYICAVFLTQTIGHNASMWGSEHSADIHLWFGTIGNSMRTLFIIITLAEWDHIALVVSKHVNGFVVFVLAIAYITLTAFTMVSLITGIISEELVGAQREDEFHKLQQIEKGKTELAEKVKELLTSFDDDGSGSLSEKEVADALHNTNLKLMERLQALDISMEMDDFQCLIRRLKEASGSDEIPIDELVKALKHLSGTASSPSVWDLKMILLQIQKDATRGNSVVEQVGTNLTSVSNDFQKNSLETREKVDQVVCRISGFEEKIQSENGRIDGKLGKLMDGLQRLDGKLQSQKSRTDDRVLDRLAKLEEIMHVLCSSLVNGGNNANAAGTGESTTAGIASGLLAVQPEGRPRLS